MYTLDLCIFGSFLATNLCVGLWYGRGVKTLREYALGDGKASTLLLVATLVASLRPEVAFIVA
jgi:Na+/proline symporter